MIFLFIFKPIVDFHAYVSRSMPMQPTTKLKILMTNSIVTYINDNDDLVDLKLNKITAKKLWSRQYIYSILLLLRLFSTNKTN